MAKLIYSAITSLDGYVADEDGRFDWAEPDEEVHTFVNDLERPVGTYLYGRRMYEVMVAWETLDAVADQPPFSREFARIWQAADKVVYSMTIKSTSTARTRIERDFDPQAVREMKASADRDLSVGGPGAAARAGSPTASVSTSSSRTNAASARASYSSATASGPEGERPPGPFEVQTLAAWACLCLSCPVDLADSTR